MHTDFHPGNASAAVLHRHHGYDVLAAPQLITWPGGSSIGLHRVLQHGHATMFLRACAHDALHWVVFDLRDVTPSTFEPEHQALPACDSDGMVLYTLRGHHANAAALLTSVLACCKSAWRAAEQGAAA